MSGSTAGILISEERVEGLLRSMLEQAVPAEKMVAMLEASARERLALYDLDEAADALRCKTRQELFRFCKLHRIEIVRFSHKKQFITSTELARAVKKASVVPGDRDGVDRSGTRIAGKQPGVIGNQSLRVISEASGAGVAGKMEPHAV